MPSQYHPSALAFLDISRHSNDNHKIHLYFDKNSRCLKTLPLPLPSNWWRAYY